MISQPGVWLIILQDLLGGMIFMQGRKQMLECTCLTVQWQVMKGIPLPVALCPGVIVMNTKVINLKKADSDRPTTMQYGQNGNYSDHIFWVHILPTVKMSGLGFPSV